MAVYGRAQLHDLALAVGRLPNLLAPKAAGQELRATGTDPAAVKRLDRALTKPCLSEATHDCDLKRLTAVWPRLPEHVRRAILTLADACQ